MNRVMILPWAYLILIIERWLFLSTAHPELYNMYDQGQPENIYQPHQF